MLNTRFRIRWCFKSEKMSFLNSLKISKSFVGRQMLNIDKPVGLFLRTFLQKRVRRLSPRQSKWGLTKKYVKIVTFTGINTSVKYRKGEKGVGGTPIPKINTSLIPQMSSNIHMWTYPLVIYDVFKWYIWKRRITWTLWWMWSRPNIILPW